MFLKLYLLAINAHNIPENWGPALDHFKLALDEPSSGVKDFNRHNEGFSWDVGLNSMTQISSMTAYQLCEAARAFLKHAEGGRACEFNLINLLTSKLLSCSDVHAGGKWSVGAKWKIFTSIIVISHHLSFDVDMDNTLLGHLYDLRAKLLEAVKNRKGTICAYFGFLCLIFSRNINRIKCLGRYVIIVIAIFILC